MNKSYWYAVAVLLGVVIGWITGDPRKPEFVVTTVGSSTIESRGEAVILHETGNIRLTLTAPDGRLWERNCDAGVSSCTLVTNEDAVVHVVVTR